MPPPALRGNRIDRPARRLSGRRRAAYSPAAFGAGGRAYLAKDLRLRPDMLDAMYTELQRFRAPHALVDPDGILRSDLGRRLGLCRTRS